MSSLLDASTLLVGHRMAGMVISQGAERAPDRISALISLATGHLPFLAQPEAFVDAVLDLARAAR